ncbi:serine hydrolase domain-containing protein [Algimonas arctica]|uniref:serine hydrolase domain-containing protein n=1 Tax=Algimonas arctica TaxID=1479486 RepID=UPI00167782AC|nr:serine hydrolase domain-containing protein [Algimonas arctica]
MTLRYLIPALLLTACGATSSGADAPTQNSAVVKIPAFDTGAMDGLLSTAVTEGDVIGVSALVFDEGQIVYQGAFGLGDRERDVAVTEDTVWRIYSMTKPVTSVVIMDLIEEGKLALTDPAAKYIPALAEMRVASLGEDGVPIYTQQARPMTIEDLLLHRAGLAYGIFGGNPIEEAYAASEIFSWGNTPEGRRESLETKVNKLGHLPLVAQPGAAWYYSLSIDVLGRVAEVVTGQTLDEVMAERIFEPLEMTETGFYVRPDQKDRFASNYMLQPDGSYNMIEDGQNSPYLIDYASNSGGGGLVSTLRDYARFSEMMLNGGRLGDVTILEPETVSLMMQDHMGDGFVTMFPWIGGETGAGFGYGGSVQKTATEAQQLTAGRYPGQWGWGGAARTNMFIDPQNNAYGIIMLQFFGGENPEIHRDFQALTLKETRNDNEISND